ncbi:MAG: PKD domain-containing protein [Deltaproteobacteria bacterium]|nr:PKD domain-containing protein [Deltaproteobacteria bacterium]
MKVRISALVLIAGLLSVWGCGSQGNWAEIANLPPTADFSFSPATANPGEEVQFQSLAGDPDGSLVSVRWSFGDGATAEGDAVGHTYAEPGSYSVTLTVADGHGAKGTVTKSLTVNHPPVASFGVTPAAGIKAGQAVQFTSTSTDADGTIVASQWNFGDASPAADGTEVTHIFDAAGTFTVTLSVTDDAHATASASQTLVVRAPLVASFRAVPDLALVTGQSVQFTSMSTSPGGTFVSMAWDFGDGTSAAGPTAAHAFARSAVYPVTLTVTDDTGDTASSSQSVLVQDPVNRRRVAGSDHSLAVRDDGTAWSWGSSSDGQLGNETDGLVAAQVLGLSRVATVAAGGGFSLALTADGHVWAWGTNTRGQLGVGSSEPSKSAPVEIPGLADAVALAAGAGHALALGSDRMLRAWGDNSAGQLGSDAPASSSSPLPVGTAGNIVTLAAGRLHSVAVDADGLLYTWGANDKGQLGDGTTTARAAPLPVQGVVGVVAVAAGDAHTLALKRDGTVWAWGDNSTGALGDGSTEDRVLPVQVSDVAGVVAVAASGRQSYALAADGTVWQWGSLWGDGGLLSGQVVPARVAGLNGVTGIAAGLNYALAVTADTAVRGWGTNTDAQLGDGSAPEGTGSTAAVAERTRDILASVLTGGAHFLALRQDGRVLAWGAGGSGQLGDGAARSRSVAITVQGLTNAAAVATGEQHSLSATASGKVLAWGDNSGCQLGIGDRDGDAHGTPTEVAGPGDVVAVGAGAWNSFAITRKGALWAWGDDEFGKLGIGGSGESGTCSPVPVKVEGLEGVVAASGSRQHTLALTAEGLVWAWGGNAAGELGDGTTTPANRPLRVPGLSEVVAIAAANGFSAALQRDGTLWAWGDGGFGSAPTQQAGLPMIAALSTRYAVDSEGKAWDWWSREEVWSGLLPPVTAAFGAGDGSSGTPAFAALAADGAVWSLFPSGKAAPLFETKPFVLKVVGP